LPRLPEPRRRVEEDENQQNNMKPYKITLKKGTIRHLQKYIAQKCKEWNFEDETLHEKLLLLTEEVGELIHACRKISGMNLDTKRKTTAQVEEEMADVIMISFDVADKLGVDIEKEFFKKSKIIDERKYKRATKSKY